MINEITNTEMLNNDFIPEHELILTNDLNAANALEKIFLDANRSLSEIIAKMTQIAQYGFNYPAGVKFRITLKTSLYRFFDPDYITNLIHVNNIGSETFIVESIEYKKTAWYLTSELIHKNKNYGFIEVYYDKHYPNLHDEPFLKEEKKFFDFLAHRFSNFLHFKILNEKVGKLSDEIKEFQKPEWHIILDIFRKTDQNLFTILSRKMLNFLFTKGIEESKELFRKLGSNIDFYSDNQRETNRPSKKEVLVQAFNLGMEIYSVAAKYFSENDIMAKIQRWVHEEKSNYLVKALANLNTPISELSEAIRKYYFMNPMYDSRTSSTTFGIRVSLIRRILSDQLQYIEIAKNFMDTEDFVTLTRKMIFPPESHGKLGGKSAGIFLGIKILEKSSQVNEILKGVKTPKTWYLASDGLINFMYYNNMEDLIEQKYKDIEEVRQEYPYIIQAFKNSNFSQEMVNGLSRALDDFGNNPIVVRSSSLLEDRVGAAFAGKYKSLFLANQGTKQERLEALQDAIAEVYASTYGPDPIGYRAEKGLVDFNEEMGVLIQEVVGTRVGKYFFPAFAGVAFSNNEFRWSPRIKREDGLIRMVPGLGTRAVDRIGDDFPMLIAPGQPDLRVNLTNDEILNYSPKKIDVINLETNTFDTISIDSLVKDVGAKFPMLNEIFSIVEGHHIRKPVGLGIDPSKHDVIVSFDNLIQQKKYIEQIYEMLKELKANFNVPVDLEFACDGKNLYLLQCRPQSSGSENVSAIMPTNVPKDKVIFTANKYISNGKVPDITYMVYVDPIKYYACGNLEQLINVGRAVSKLNSVLPKKTFILMGPGRWGSRDDIRLGVKVTYSDINNTAMLIEIAKHKENYVPELSFGTHFFQDLVEAGIRYLPLYPDDEGVVFNREFFFDNENILTRFVPEYDEIGDMLKVINVREATGGFILRVLMNADQEIAMAILENQNTFQEYSADELVVDNDQKVNEPLHWRKRMAEAMAGHLDAKRFGVKALYLYGTVFNETADSNSDVDILVHFDGTEDQRRDLEIWLEGWNAVLSQLNYNRSGFLIEKFLDVSYITDHDLKEQKYYADLIGSDGKKSMRLDINE